MNTMKNVVAPDLNCELTDLDHNQVLNHLVNF